MHAVLLPIYSFAQTNDEQVEDNVITDVADLDNDFEQANKESNDQKSYKQSISVYGSPFIGLAVNYDYLIKPQHSVMAELSYGILGQPKESWTGSVAYRYYPYHDFKGLFFGAYTRAGYIHQKLKIKEDGIKTTHNLETPIVQVGIDFLGYRIQNKSGLTTVLKLGYGANLYSDFQWDIEPEETKRDLYEALLGVNLELSTGWSF